MSFIEQKKGIYLSFFLTSFLIAAQITGAETLDSKMRDVFFIFQNIFYWKNFYFSLSFLLSVLAFNFLVSNKETSGSRLWIEGNIYLFLGGLICYFSFNEIMFIYGRIIQGVGTGVTMLSLLIMVKYEEGLSFSRLIIYATLGFIAEGILELLYSINIINFTYDPLEIYYWYSWLALLSIVVWNINFFQTGLVKISKFNVFKVFLGTEIEAEVKKKTIGIAVLFPVYCALEYFLAGLTLALVVFMKLNKLSELTIFLILWIINIILSGSAIIFNDWTGIDFTTMEGRRRWLNAFIKRSNLAGRISAVIFEFFYGIYLIIWDGADWFMLFFRDRIHTKKSKFIVFFLSTAIQMAIWTKIYSLGYDGISQLFKYYF